MIITEAVRAFQLYNRVVSEAPGTDAGERSTQSTLADIRQWLALKWPSGDFAR